MSANAFRRRRRPSYEPLPITDRQLDAAVSAAHHLLAYGLPPLFSLPTIRALWRRDRELALRLARYKGVLP